MKLELKRYISGNEFTIGNLSIDGVYECKVIEDEYRQVKVMSETRIPDGEYEIKLRTFGGHHQKYKKKPFHKGMLWLQDVPNFKDILIHIGNSPKDSSGCLLTVTNVDEKTGVGTESTKAYDKMYKKVVAAFDRGEKVTIKISS
jgi:hypothetical protein